MQKTKQRFTINSVCSHYQTTMIHFHIKLVNLIISVLIYQKEIDNYHITSDSQKRWIPDLMFIDNQNLTRRERTEFN